jgi:uncharacterized RDD family membrane protein YckC
MWVCKNCHEEVDGVLIECWNCSYSRDGSPPSHEFKKVKPVDENRPGVVWLSRGVAYLIDVSVFVLAWGIINNCVFWPVPELAMELAALILFIGYFAVTEGMSTPNASWGKRFERLRVVSQTGDSPRFATILKRSLVVGAMVIFDWRLISNLFAVPELVGFLALAVPLGVCLYNVWLAVFSPGGLMLHDRFTGTQVHWNSKTLKDTLKASSASGKNPKRFYKPQLAIGMVAAIVVLWSLFTVVVTGDGGFGSIFDPSGRTVENSAARVIENAAADQIGIRCVASVTNQIRRTWNSDQPAAAERQLLITIWIPAVLWTDKVLSRLPEIALSRLTITPGFYDSGTLSISTGPSPFTWSRSFSLNTH